MTTDVIANRLTQVALDTVPETVIKPSYNRQALQVGIVHLGMGAFHRAHMAVYTDTLLNLEGGDWRILGVSLRSPAVRDRLQPQQGLYTVAEMQGDTLSHRIIGAVADVLVAPENPQTVLAAMAAPGCRIISLTITEKGYCHDPASGDLNLDNAGIRRDLESCVAAASSSAVEAAPATAIGYLVEALRRRRQAGIEPVTVLCCDNLPENGSTLKKIVLQFAAQCDPALADWIAEQVPFPNTMVDRIVPATLDEDIQRLSAECGYLDKGMVKTEVFTQWVIEDRFAAGRPAWERAGATLVEDVAPFELAKLRLLNGAHSSLAYLGFIAGYPFVHQVMEDNDFCVYLRGLMLDEIVPTLSAPPGMDLVQYVDSLLQRFSNASLRHKTYQIAMDGSQKLPQRLLGTVRDRLQQRAPIEHLALAVAGWMRYVLGFDARGEVIEVQDPLVARLQEIGDTHFHNIDDLVENYLNLREIFDADLAVDETFKNRVTYWLAHILANGVPTTLRVFLTEKASRAANVGDSESKTEINL